MYCLYHTVAGSSTRWWTHEYTPQFDSVSALQLYDTFHRFLILTSTGRAWKWLIGVVFGCVGCSLSKCSQLDQPSHKTGAGRYGHLTWEWAAGIRGFSHPLLFAVVYKVGYTWQSSNITLPLV